MRATPPKTRFVPWGRTEMSELRDLVRQILSEELARMGGASPGVTEETVTIHSSAELNAFALRLLKQAQDGRLRTRMEAGHHRFILAQGAAGTESAQAHQPRAPAPAAPRQAEFRCGLVTEREIAGLAEGTKKLTIGKSVRLTPLARDELASRGITLERKAS